MLACPHLVAPSVTVVLLQPISFAPSFPNRPVRQMAKKESKKSKTQGKKNAANEGVAGESAHWFHLPTCNVRMAYFS